LPLIQRRHRAHGAKHSTHDVVDTGTRTKRIALAARHVGQSPHHLHNFIESRPILVGPGKEPFVADVNQTRIQLAQGFVVQAQPFHGARLKVFTDNIGGRDEPQSCCNAFGPLQVERNAFFVAIEARKKSGA